MRVNRYSLVLVGTLHVFEVIHITVHHAIFGSICSRTTLVCTLMSNHVESAAGDVCKSLLARTRAALAGAADEYDSCFSTPPYRCISSEALFSTLQRQCLPCAMTPADKFLVLMLQAPSRCGWRRCRCACCWWRRQSRCARTLIQWPRRCGLPACAWRSNPVRPSVMKRHFNNHSSDSAVHIDWLVRVHRTWLWQASSCMLHYCAEWGLCWLCR